MKFPEMWAAEDAYFTEKDEIVDPEACNSVDNLNGTSSYMNEIADVEVCKYTLPVLHLYMAPIK